MISSPLFYTVLAVLIAVIAVLRAVSLRRGLLEGLFAAAGRVETGVIAILLIALVLLGCMQIVLRNFFHSGMLWADPMMRHLVLWLGCLGAALATTRVRHINIDVFSRLVPARHRGYRRTAVYAATAIAAYFLGVAALRLVVDERQFGEVAFGPMKTWMLQIVLPYAFFVISYRSLVNLFIGREGRPVDGTAEPLES